GPSAQERFIAWKSSAVELSFAVPSIFIAASLRLTEHSSTTRLSLLPTVAESICVVAGLPPVLPVRRMDADRRVEGDSGSFFKPRRTLMSKATAALEVGATIIMALLTVGLARNATAGVHVAQPLTATSHAPNAHGRAKLALKSASKGRFRVLARGLAPRASFDLVVGGVKVGTFTTNGHGSGKIMLSTHPKPSEGLLGVDPRGK